MGELLENYQEATSCFFFRRICSLNISSIPIGSHVWYLYLSRGNEVYPYQRTPMGNPYINPIYSGYLWVRYPQESQG